MWDRYLLAPLDVRVSSLADTPTFLNLLFNPNWGPPSERENLIFVAVCAMILIADPAVYVMQCDALSQHFVRRELISEGADDVLAVMVAVGPDHHVEALGKNRQVSTHLWLFGSKSQAAHGMAGSLRTQFGARMVAITVQDAFVSQMKQRLEAEQAMIAVELRNMRSLTGTDDSFSEHAGLGNHMADDATEVFEQEKNLTIQQHTAELLAKVEAALRMIDTGRYGLCERCGSPIDRARLETLPYVTLCIDCKVRQEKI